MRGFWRSCLTVVLFAAVFFVICCCAIRADGPCRVCPTAPNPPQYVQFAPAAQQYIIPPGGKAIHDAADGSKWYIFDDRPHILYCTTQPVGHYDCGSQQWTPYRGNNCWGESTSTLPHILPVEAVLQVAKKLETGANLPTGVESQHIVDGQYHVNGTRTTREYASNLIESKLSDESTKRRITIIGEPKDRQAAIDMLPKDFKTWAVLKAYDPGDWYVQQSGFVNGGSPTVYCQEPDGSIVHRQDDLKDLESAYQKMNPNYDPSKDPDIRVHGIGGVNKPTLYMFFAGMYLFGVVSAFAVPWFFARMAEKRRTAEAQQQVIAKQQQELQLALTKLLARADRSDTPKKSKPSNDEE